MSPSTLRLLAALFLIAHGWIHYSLTTVPVPAPGALRTPFWPSWWRENTDPQWLASRLGLQAGLVRSAGWILWVAVVAGFCFAGLGLLNILGLNAIWQGAGIFGAIASLLLLIFYWHPWLVVGAVIDLAVLVGIWQQLPASLFSLR
jgi:hypothetical protein